MTPKLPSLLLTFTLLLPSILCLTCSATQSSIQLGNSTIVCVHIVTRNGSTDVVNTYAFKTTVDKFSAFKIANINGTFGASLPIYAVVQVQNSNVTQEMLLFSPTLKSGTFRSLFSFVVNIDSGVVTTITDDNADCGNCDTTNNQVCDQETSYKCYTKGLTYKAADPRFFISWIGTDASGNHMLSHTKRLSRFTQYSIGSVYNKVITTFN